MTKELAESVKRLREYEAQNQQCVFPDKVQTEYYKTIEALVNLVGEISGAIPSARKAVKMQCYLDEYPEPSGKAKDMFYKDMAMAETIVQQALTKAAPIAALAKEEK